MKEPSETVVILDSIAVSKIHFVRRLLGTAFLKSLVHFLAILYVNENDFLDIQCVADLHSYELKTKTTK